MLLTREMAIKADHLETVEVDVTEWGEINPETGEREKTTVLVKELTAGERDRFEQSRVVTRRNGTSSMDFSNTRAKLAVMVCVDADGNRLFSDEDVQWLTKRSVRPLSRIFDAAMKLNAFTNDEESEEDQLKN
jgi:hypothetical protein